MSNLSEQEYVAQVVDPVLKELRDLLIQQRPLDPLPAILQYVKSRKPEPSVSDLLNTVKGQSSLLSDDDEEEGISSPISAGVLSPSHSPRNLQKYFERGARSSFSAPPTEEIFRLYEHPVTEGNKTPVEISRIKRLLEKSALARDRTGSEIDQIARAMTEVVISEIDREVELDSNVIVVEEGSLYKSCPGGKTATLTTGDVIGDPSGFYVYCPESTVLRTGSEKVVFWTISRNYLDYLTRRIAIEKREKYLNFLSSVPIFASMDEEEIEKVCDALKHESIKAGTTFIHQGDVGNKFYIVESGECVAMRSYVPGQIPTQIFRYKTGDYLGELSLLHNEPRAASVMAATDVSLLSIDRRSFKRLLGPIQDILLRNTVRYQHLNVQSK